MRKYFVLIYLSIVTLGFSQNPEIKSDLPTVIPPAPTVAALMKFEEVPVSKYTGVPDVKIDLLNVNTLSKDLFVNLALKYHPSSVNVNEVAGDLGLGWSLNRGGVISRTVKGCPDERYVTHSTTNKLETGIYRDDVSVQRNNYYNCIDNPISYMNNNQEEANEFIWEALNTGKFDTEHDLWQFDFFGKSGRFYIKKNSNGVLEVMPLEDYRIKIINHYSTNATDKYTPISFTVIDESGYRFVFDVIETTLSLQATESMYVNGTTFNIYGGQGPVFNPIVLPPSLTNISTAIPHISAFYLSKVFDLNNNLIIDYEFSDQEFKESQKISSLSTTEYKSDTLGINFLDIALFMTHFNCFYEFKPFIEVSNTITLTNVKKVSKINIRSVGTVEFSYEKGRFDDNIAAKELVPFLKSVQLRNIDGELIKKYTFNYNYNTTLYQRLFLNEVEVIDRNETTHQNYTFDYRQNPINGKTVGIDKWGYHNINFTCRINNQFYNNVTPEFTHTETLQKIKYPTGGSVIFDYESNSYSYKRDIQLSSTEILENEDNFILSSNSPYTYYFNQNTSNIHLLGVSNQMRKVVFYPSLTLSNDPNLNNHKLVLCKKVNNNWVSVQNLFCINGAPDCCITLYLNSGEEYCVRREIFDIQYQGEDSIGIYIYEQASNLKHFIYGGGNRIKKIAYFDKNVPSNIFQYPQGTYSFEPVKVLEFNYDFPQTNTSSGALSSVEPVFNYEGVFNIDNKCNSYFSSPMYFFYTTTTRSSNISAIKTQGSDVGYKHVKVYETNNGFTTYEFKAPQDIVEPVNRFNLQSPFIPILSLDHKRGLLLKEKIYHQTGRLLKEVSNEYETNEVDNVTGIRFYFNPKNIGSTKASTVANKYSLYKLFLETGNPYISGPNYLFALTKIPSFYKIVNAENVQTFDNIHNDTITRIRFFILKERYGWSNLIKKSTVEYFYPDGSNYPLQLAYNERFEYNPLNKMIAEHKVINPEGEETRTSYTYFTDPAVLAQNRIAEIERIEVHKDGELLQTSQIEYSNTFPGNPSHLPQRILTAKGNQPLESKIRYNRYDSYGNPLEVQQEDGMQIAYVWGYNHTQVVAKIENCSYQAIPAQFLTAIEQATANGSESDVLNALDALRNAPALSQAMVTTVTHIPLVGMSTLTDPKGVRIKYHYDAMNRLEKVTDHYGNIVTENSYNYRP